MINPLLGMAGMLAGLVLLGQPGHGQSQPLVYHNDTNAYYGKNGSGMKFLEPKVNEITLRPDSTFEFWSRPHMSCFSWKSYKGKWGKQGDTLLLVDTYKIQETDARIKYSSDAKLTYRISFKTDEGAVLKNKKITLAYVYDFSSKSEDIVKVYVLPSSNVLVIPFNEVPNRENIASIRVEYELDKETRTGYLTAGEILNEKIANLPNKASVEFVEYPRQETVYRTSRAVVQQNKLLVISTKKTKVNLPDYHPELLFEDEYTKTE